MNKPTRSTFQQLFGSYPAIVVIEVTSFSLIKGSHKIRLLVNIDRFLTEPEYHFE